MQKAKSAESDIYAAAACAEGFLRVAESLVAAICKLPEGRLPTSDMLPPDFGDTVVAATNLAFALELYIKVFLVASHVDLPRGREGHDVGDLYAALPKHFKVVIEKYYEETRRADWHGNYPSVTLSKGRRLETPDWNKHADAASFDLSKVLAYSGDLFTSWRYIYEFTEPGPDECQIHHFHYALLLSACHAMQRTLEFCKGAGPSFHKLSK